MITNIKNPVMLLIQTVVATKKILVIVLIVVLVSSVAAGASSLFRGTPSNRVEEQDINTELNRIVDFCMESLPTGIPECDGQLKEMVDNSCRATGNSLDACKNNKVDKYYRSRLTK
jgi:hypothetical protein